MKSRVVVISKLLTIFSNCALRCFQLHDGFGRWIVCSKRSMALCNFSFEMNSDANIGAHRVYWTKSQRLTQTNWIR